jgi:hypothetical protein
MSTRWCCPYCGEPLEYDELEERYVCHPCGKAFGDWGGGDIEGDAVACAPVSGDTR